MAALRRPIMVAGAAMVLLAAGAFGYWHWYNTANVLFSYGDVNQSHPNWPVGKTMYVNAEIQPKGSKTGHRRLDVRRVTPLITVNTAQADVVVITCRVADGHTGIGMTDNTSVCASVAAFHPGSIDLGFPATELVYKVTPTRPGVVRVEGADVRYSDGSRRDVQHAGSGFVIQVVPA